MSDTTIPHKGSCLCGAVQFNVTGPLRDILYCHCEQCRKTSGHHFAATGCQDELLLITEDRGLKWFESSERAKRGFCCECGSSLFWKHKKLDYTTILAGSLELPTNLKARAHIFVKDKADYFDLKDGLPQYEGYPVDETFKMET